MTAIHFHRLNNIDDHMINVQKKFCVVFELSMSANQTFFHRIWKIYHIVDYTVVYLFKFILAMVHFIS